MLQNDYLVAKIGVDTAENEPQQVPVFKSLVGRTGASGSSNVHFHHPISELELWSLRPGRSPAAGGPGSRAGSAEEIQPLFRFGEVSIKVFQGCGKSLRIFT